MGRMALLAAAVIASVAALLGQLGGAFTGSLDDPSIGYATKPVHDLVSELNRKLDQGQVHLKFDDAHGYLQSTLEALNVPVESQIAIFSKTSFQGRLISPRNPRAIYFNDSVSVGWVRGGTVVELAAQDPQQGVIFYTLNQAAVEKPRFMRRDECLQCHESYSTAGVPGMLVRSVFTAPNGVAVFQFGSYTSDHRSPFNQRWGGFYVTADAGSARHMGNAVVTDVEKPEKITIDATPNISDYLAPYSDIVALMVFDHQMHMTNLLTRVGWETRYDKRFDVRGAAKEFVDYLLFLDEAPLEGRIHGVSGFAEHFAKLGPRDSKGRSLRQFDLERRLMRYPCSYMIYSAAFDALPAEAKDAIYKRMWQILSGEEKTDRLSFADREAVVEILRETKRGLPDYFRSALICVHLCSSVAK